MLRALSRKLLRSLYRSMIAYGSMYTTPPPVSPAAGSAHRSAPRITGPSGAHPERVPHDTSLTALERRAGLAEAHTTETGADR